MDAILQTKTAADSGRDRTKSAPNSGTPQSPELHFRGGEGNPVAALFPLCRREEETTKTKKQRRSKRRQRHPKGTLTQREPQIRSPRAWSTRTTKPCLIESRLLGPKALWEKASGTPLLLGEAESTPSSLRRGRFGVRKWWGRAGTLRGWRGGRIRGSGAAAAAQGEGVGG